MSKAEAVASVDVLLKINEVVIGGQLNAELTRETQTLDITNKSCRGKREFIVLSDQWNVKCDGYYLLGDQGHRHLIDAIHNYKLLDISLRFSENYIMSGKCLIESYPIAMHDKKEVTYSLNLIGSGELKEIIISEMKDFSILDGEGEERK